MPWSLFKRTANVNLKPGEDVQTSHELRYEPNHGWTPSSETEVNVVNIGAEVRQETVKYETGSKTGSMAVVGPSAGAELGFKSNANRTGVSAMAELSAARAEGALNVTDNAAVYASANLNANTGAKIGTDGVEVNVLGFGLTLGVGGKFTVNTPVGSVGGCATNAITQTVRNDRRNTNRRSNENVYTN